MTITTDNETILRSVLDKWKAALDAHDPGVQRVVERNPAPELVFAGQMACYPTCGMTSASVSRVTQQGREPHKQKLPPDPGPQPSVPRFLNTAGRLGG
jgi:hypothetical protein